MRFDNQGDTRLIPIQMKSPHLYVWGDSNKEKNGTLRRVDLCHDLSTIYYDESNYHCHSGLPSTIDPIHVKINDRISDPITAN